MKNHEKKISDTSSHKYAWLLVGFGNRFLALSVCVLLGTSMEIGHVLISWHPQGYQPCRVKMPLSGSVSHEASIQSSLHRSSLQLGADGPYQSQSQKNPKDIQFECSSKKYLIIFDKRCKIWQHLNVFWGSSDGIWSHKLSRVHDSSMPEHRTATKEAADLPVFLGDLRWIVSSQLPPSS